MKFRPALFDGVDLLILLLAIGALVLVGVVLTVRDVEIFLSIDSSAAGGEAIATAQSDPVDIERSRRSGWQALLSSWDVHDVVFHDGLVYMATGGGLLAYLPSGELAGRYTHLNGLPGNQLSCLAVWNGDLYIGSDAGLVRLREGLATTFRPNITDGSKITSVLSFADRLLVGTDGAGLLSFDGASFRRDLGGLPGSDFRSVTALADWGGQLAVGSRDLGLFILRGASFTKIDDKNGLPDNCVTDLAPGDNLLAATVSGLCLIDEQLQVVPWTRPVMASAALRTAGGALVGTLDGRLEFYSAGRRRRESSLGDRRNPVLIRQISLADKRTWVLTDDGPYMYSPEGLNRFGERPGAELRNNHISALALDAGGNLWVGYFDAGIEVFSPNLQLVNSFDEDHCRTVKCMYFDPAENAVYAGSSKGLIRYLPDGGATLWTTEEGLISNEVNHVSRRDDEIVAGTGGGISFVSSTAVRSVYAFHGLINNRVFSLLPYGEDLVAGTLGGISIVSGYQVGEHITPENSPLPTHWVTALGDLDGALLIGTYGGGLALRDAAGQWQELPPNVRELEVNPNAVLATQDLFLVGTLDRGLVIYRRDSKRWEVTSGNLSSPNVTALATDGRKLFIATDNGIMIVDHTNL